MHYAKNLRTLRDELQCIFLGRSVWPSVSIAHLREVTDPRADPLPTHNSVTWFYPFLFLSDQKYPTNLTRYQRAKERSCYRRVPSLPWHPRAEEELWVWSGPCQEDLGSHHQRPGSLIVKTPKRAQTLQHPSTLHPLILFKIWYSNHNICC